jgi:O-antigen/teichoic acid export membrane protein
MIMRFIKSSSATIAFKALSMFCGLGISILIGRALGPSGRGVYGLILTIIVLSTNFGIFGLAGANAYLIGNDKSRSRSVGAQSLVVGLLGAALAIACLQLIDWNSPSVFADLPDELLIPTYALIPLFLLGMLFSYSYLGQGRIVAFNIFESGEKLIVLLLGFLIIIVFKAGLEAFMVSIAAAIFVLLAAYIAVYFAGCPGGVTSDFKLLTPAFSYGIRSYVATVLTYAVMRSGIFFVNHYLGTAEAGLYTTAQQLSELLIIIPGVVGTVLFSRIAGGEKSQLTARVVRTAAFVLFPLFVLLALSRNLVIVALFGPEFKSAADVFLVFLPGAYLLGLEVILASDIAGRGYPWPAALAWFPVLSINVIGYWLLIPIYGILGAAISTTFSFFILFGFVLFYYKRLSRQSLSEILLIKHVDITTIRDSVVAALFAMKWNKNERDNAAETLPRQSQAEIKRIGAKV